MTTTLRSESLDTLPQATAWRAVLDRDARYDGRFVYAVESTGIFCRPSCPSRRPLAENVRFFLSDAEAQVAGFRPCKRCEPMAAGTAQTRLIDTARAWLEENAARPVTLAALARACGASVSHLQRTFTRVVGMSPKRYHDGLRARALRTELRRGALVSRATYEAGYGSSSRVYERAPALLGMTPAAYKRGGAGTEIRFAVARSRLGAVLVAFTERGLCHVALGESAEELERALRFDFHAASISRAKSASNDWVRAIVTAIDDGHHADVPLDVAGTEFQRRVWRELRRIPAGATRSYADVAAAIGRPSATRAVARACAANPAAIAIPCHRVIRGDGGLGGYRWGLKRKEELLRTEGKPTTR
jgi:AraC family transcriptional regulator of adaptative response/methylated-DNA-[protein]-cysteine methyltransferase